MAKKRGIAVLNDVLFISGSGITLAFACILVYTVILAVAPLATESKGIATFTAILSFLQFLDFAMLVAFIGLCGISIWLAYLLNSNSLFMFFWIAIFAILVPMSNTLSGVYNEITGTPAFSVAMANLPYFQLVMAHLPIWLTVVGFIGFIATFGKQEAPPVSGTGGW